MDGFDYIILSAQRHPSLGGDSKLAQERGGRPVREWQNCSRTSVFEQWTRVGKLVNLERHEVVEVINTESVPDETVVEVRQKGYLYKNRVLRDARVVVAKNERR